jgi:alpha-beta hydrolase superfamily lysophospholipase
MLLSIACAAPVLHAGKFYDVDTTVTIPKQPGVLIRHAPIKGAPVAAHAYKVLYSSTGMNGEPIDVSGIVVIPDGPAPTRGWDVVAWAHPTTGVATGCAPSLREDPYATIPGLANLLSRGYVVSATDYPGLGTAGTHPYLVGVSEGRAVLDLLRAERSIPGEKIGTRFAVWGHSQGGHAAFFAGELASSYAPEFTLVGVGAAAPATDLGLLLNEDMSSVAGHVLMSFAVWSWVRVYGAPTTNFVVPEKLHLVDSVAQHCIVTYREAYHAGVAAVPLDGAFLTYEPDTLQPWRNLMERNRPGAIATPAPIFIAQGTADIIVNPAVTFAYAQHLCSLGVRVHYVSMPEVPHEGAAISAASMMVDWLAARFSGNPAASDCGVIGTTAGAP